MKRTMTAATAFLLSSAGAVGFAGTANAGEPASFPVDPPMDNNVANTAFHAAGTMYSAKQAVGDVVPVDDVGSTVENVTSAVGDVVPVDEALPKERTQHVDNRVAGNGAPLEQQALPEPLGPLVQGVVDVLKPGGSTLPTQPPAAQPAGQPVTATNAPLVEHGEVAPQPKVTGPAGDQQPDAVGMIADTAESVLTHGALGEDTNLSSS